MKKNLVAFLSLTATLVACSNNKESNDTPFIPKVTNSYDAIASLPNHVQERVTAWTGKRVKGCDTGDLLNSNGSLLFLDAKILADSSHIITRQSGNLGAGFAALTDFIVPTQIMNSEIKEVFREPSKQTAFQLNMRLKNGFCELSVNGVVVSSTQMYQSAKINTSWHPARGVTPQLPMIVSFENGSTQFKLGANTPSSLFFTPREQDFDFISEVWAIPKESLRRVVELKQSFGFQESLKQENSTRSWQPSNQVLEFDSNSLGNLDFNNKNSGKNVFEHKIILPAFQGKGVSLTQKTIYSKIQIEASAKPGESAYLKYTMFSAPILLGE